RMEALGLDPDTARMIFDGKTIAEITGAGAPQHPVPAAATPVTTAPADTSADPRAAELQALWAEVLGVPEVSIHESFYDLGGDSLSALTVIMRMEALGLDPDTARMIFDGKTIAEITGAGAPQHPVPAAATPVTTAPADTSADPRAAELQALWAEVLGVPEVSIHESFYDLGGDSLSALTVIMRMEALGLDPDTARMIFDGKTIAEITAAGGGTAAPPPAAAPPAAPVQPMPAPAASAPEAGGLTFPEMMNAVHATRGVLILWVVVVHWLPGALERISQEAIWIYDMLYPALRYGTPGFAMVFGLGIGALGVYHYAKNPAQFLKGNRFNTRLILGGVLFMALFRLLSLLTGSGLDDAYSVSFMFYSAIAYYALAMLTMPLLMRLLQIGPDRVLTALTIGAICLLIHEGLSATIAPLKPGGVLELAKILLTAKYGYFHMTSYVMVGVVMGLLLRQFHHRPRIAKDMLLYGTVLIIFGFVMLYEVRALPGLSDFGLVYPWHLMIYAGLTLWIIAAFCALNRGVARHGSVLRLGNSFAIASGILALPIFVGHEVVIPAKAVLVNLGMSDALGLIVPLAVFLVALGLGYQRLMKFLIR
ncbi:phosphopantetheine-binding protein, partial [Roseobacter sinensis]